MTLNLATRIVTKTRDRMALDVDICVVGAGAAGVMAALTAAKLGKRTVLLDAMPTVGGQLVSTLLRSFVEWRCSFEDFPRAVRKKLLQEVADSGPRQGFDIGALGPLRDGTQLAQAGRPRVRADDDYTKFVRPDYELGCDVGERRSRAFWQRRFGVTPD